MKISNIWYRLWVWFGVSVLKASHTVNFTPPDDLTVHGVGFAWTENTAMMMRGDPDLHRRLAEANNLIATLRTGRNVRRIVSSQSQKILKKIQ